MNMGEAMDKGIVERAVQALIALNADRRNEIDSVKTPKLSHVLVRRIEVGRPEAIAHCAAPECAGCYEVGDGKKFHPPRCGEGFLRWRAWLEGKGNPH